MTLKSLTAIPRQWTFTITLIEESSMNLEFVLVTIDTKPLLLSNLLPRKIRPL